LRNGLPESAAPSLAAADDQEAMLSRRPSHLQRLHPWSLIVSISRRILLGKLGLALPAAVLLAATGARAANETGVDMSPTSPTHHHKKRKNHHTVKHQKQKTVRPEITTG
jgi:hypothetical protein